MTLEPKRSALFGTVPLVTLVDSCLPFGGWFRLVPTLVVGSVATLTQQADLRFDKEAMLKMIRESRERSQEWFVIPCTQTAHRRFLYFYESVSLSAAYTWLFRPFVRLSIYRSVWIPLLLIYTPRSNGHSLRRVAMHAIGGKHHSPRTGTAHGGCCTKCLDRGDRGLIDRGPRGSPIQSICKW